PGNPRASDPPRRKGRQEVSRPGQAMSTPAARAGRDRRGCIRRHVMSFQLRPEEALRKSLRRIVRRQMDAVLEELAAAPPGPRDEAVHEARKSLKKIRAVLRLVRPAVGEKCYRRENTCFRDAGRPLTEVRDARILLETLDKLLAHFQEHIA